MIMALNQRPTNLFIVGGPLQMLSAIEARDRFHAGENNVLAVIRTPLRRGAPKKHVRATLAGLIDDQWDDVWFPHLSKFDQAMFSLVSLGFSRRHPRADTVYTGSFQSPQRRLLQRIEHDRLVLIDDGCAIHATIKRHRHLRLDENCQALSPSNGNPLEVFTCFDVDWPASLVTRNDFRHLRDRLATTLPVRDDELVFISQPIDCALGIDVEHERIADDLLQLPGIKSLRWINHPREANPCPFGEYLSYPIELFPSKEGYLPGMFATYFSSAIRTLKILYGSDAYCLAIDDSQKEKPAPFTLADIYEDYQQDGVKLLPFQEAYRRPCLAAA